MDLTSDFLASLAGRMQGQWEIGTGFLDLAGPLRMGRMTCVHGVISLDVDLAVTNPAAPHESGQFNNGSPELQ